MTRSLVRLCCILLATMLVLGGCAPAEEHPGRITITYWEKWTNFEKDAMTDIVNRYNASQDKVFVKYLSISQIDRKLLLAAAGGNPPDIAGFWSDTVVSFADKGALLPLDGLMKRDGIARADYLPSMIECCEYKGFMWGLPSTPGSLGLHYNKKEFREAGLDPDKPPTSIKELNEYARKLTKYAPDGSITQMGLVPHDPGWWPQMWGWYFGGHLVDADCKTVTCDSPENVRAYKWFRSFVKDYDGKAVRRFDSSFRGQFASPSNSFMAERVAMQLQGVWMSSFIKEYGPNVEWAVAPFPGESGDTENPPALMMADLLVIPRGVKHVEEAWDFIKFVQQQKNMEELCLKQRKFSPLVKVSEDFYKGHPNPYIRVFRKLAESKNAYPAPDVPIWAEYKDELNSAVQQIWTSEEDVDVEALLKTIKKRLQPKLDRANERWDLVKEARLKEWNEETNSPDSLQAESVASR